MKKLLFIALFSILALSVSAQEMLVGSYNIRYKNRNDSLNGNVWTKRCQVICDQVNFMNPLIFGTQEVLYGQLQEARTVIAEFNEINLLLSIIDKSEHFDSNFIDRCCLKIQAVINKAMDAAEKASEESENKED